MRVSTSSLLVMLIPTLFLYSPGLRAENQILPQREASEKIGPALFFIVKKNLLGEGTVAALSALLSEPVQVCFFGSKIKVIIYAKPQSTTANINPRIFKSSFVDVAFKNRRIVEAFVEPSFIPEIAADPTISFIELPIDYSLPRQPIFLSLPASFTAMGSDPNLKKLIRKTRLKKYWNRGFRGQEITVAVIDRAFRDLDIKISEGKVSAIPEERRFNFVDTDQYGLDGPDAADSKHGTATLEVVTSFAPEAELVAIRSLGYTGQFARAIEQVKELKVDFFLVNMGFVGYPDGQSPFSQMMADAASKKILPIGSINNQALSYTGTFKYSNGFTTFGEDGNDYIEIFNSGSRTVNVYLDWEPGKSADLMLDLYRRSGNDIVLVTRVDKVGSATHLQCWEQVIWNGVDQPVIKVRSKTANTDVKFRLLNMDLWSQFSVINSPTTMTVPSDALKSFTVGAVRAGKYSESGREFYSSFGPTADGRIKPDIMGAARLWSSTWEGEFYGTSCATPMVMGILASYKSSNPKKGSRQLQKAIRAAAIPAGEGMPNNSFGYGLIRLPKPPKQKRQPQK